MKTNLKILYKTPDLDTMAEKHQDFDALMDAVTDEKIRRRKKLYRFSSFAIVIVGTAFLSWLYWGYEPASSGDVPPPQETTQPVVAEERKEPVVEEQKEEAVQQPEPELKTSEQEEKPVEQKNTTPATEATTDKEEAKAADEMALPQVTVTRKVSMDAEPVDGLENLYRYLYKEINLPDSLLEESSTLFLEVEFVVEKNGDIGEIALSKALPHDIDSVLKNIFAGMPAWKPALEANDSVASVVKLPITFQKKENDK